MPNTSMSPASTNTRTHRSGKKKVRKSLKKKKAKPKTPKIENDPIQWRGGRKKKRSAGSTKSALFQCSDAFTHERATFLASQRVLIPDPHFLLFKPACPRWATPTETCQCACVCARARAGGMAPPLPPLQPLRIRWGRKNSAALRSARPPFLLPSPLLWEAAADWLHPSTMGGGEWDQQFICLGTVWK